MLKEYSINIFLFKLKDFILLSFFATQQINYSLLIYIFTLIILTYDKEKIEYLEPNSTLIPKIKEISKLLKSCDYCAVFIGNGVSTSAKIPDFRGPKGIWTKLHKKEKIEYDVDTNKLENVILNF